MSKILSVVTPPFRARMLASWMPESPAVGSEKGMFSSMREAPFLTASRTAAAVVSKSGSPQMKKGI